MISFRPGQEGFTIAQNVDTDQENDWWNDLVWANLGPDGWEVSLSEKSGWMETTYAIASKHNLELALSIQSALNSVKVCP